MLDNGRFTPGVLTPGRGGRLFLFGLFFDVLLRLDQNDASARHASNEQIVFCIRSLLIPEA